MFALAIYSIECTKLQAIQKLKMFEAKDEIKAIVEIVSYFFLVAKGLTGHTVHFVMQTDQMIDFEWYMVSPLILQSLDPTLLNT